MIPYLQVEGLTRYWGENVLFEGLNFTITQGQKVALIARNGAGIARYNNGERSSR